MQTKDIFIYLAATEFSAGGEWLLNQEKACRRDYSCDEQKLYNVQVTQNLEGHEIGIR